MDHDDHRGDRAGGPGAGRARSAHGRRHRHGRARSRLTWRAARRAPTELVAPPRCRHRATWWRRPRPPTSASGRWRSSARTGVPRGAAAEAVAAGAVPVLAPPGAGPRRRAARAGPGCRAARERRRCLGRLDRGGRRSLSVGVRRSSSRIAPRAGRAGRGDRRPRAHHVARRWPSPREPDATSVALGGDDRCRDWPARCCSRRRARSSSVVATGMTEPPADQEYMCWMEIAGAAASGRQDVLRRTTWPTGRAIGGGRRALDGPTFGVSLVDVASPVARTPIRCCSASPERRGVGSASATRARRSSLGIVGRRRPDRPDAVEHALGGRGLTSGPRPRGRSTARGLRGPLARRRCPIRAAASRAPRARPARLRPRARR